MLDAEWGSVGFGLCVETRIARWDGGAIHCRNTLACELLRTQAKEYVTVILLGSVPIKGRKSITP